MLSASAQLQSLPLQHTLSSTLDHENRRDYEKTSAITSDQTEEPKWNIISETHGISTELSPQPIPGATVARWEFHPTFVPNPLPSASTADDPSIPNVSVESEANLLPMNDSLPSITTVRTSNNESTTRFEYLFYGKYIRVLLLR